MNEAEKGATTNQDAKRFEEIKRDHNKWHGRFEDEAYPENPTCGSCQMIVTLEAAQAEIVQMNLEIEELIDPEYEKLKFKVSNLTTERDVANREIERLKEHMPDACIQGTCNSEEHFTVGDVAAMTVNEGQDKCGLKALTHEQLAVLSDLVGDLAEKAVHSAIFDRQNQLIATNVKVEKLRKALKEWKRQIEQVISWGNAFLGEKFDQKMQENLLAICKQALADTEDK